MKVKISKWGNSLALRIPKQFTDELCLKAGSTVDLERRGSELAIEAAPRPAIPYYRLKDLLAQIEPGAEPPPFEDWGILPSEWPQDDWSDVAPSDEEWATHRREVEKRMADRRQGQRPKQDKGGDKRSR